MSRIKRRRRSASSRLRPFWIVFLLLAGTVAYALYRAATWSGFYPRHVVVSGELTVPAAEILSKAAISRRENLWLQNMGAAANRVRAIPLIGTVRIARSLPASVHVYVTERRPFAVVRAGAQSAIVDEDLRVLRMGLQPHLVQLVISRNVALRPGIFLKQKRALRLRDDAIALATDHVMARLLRYDRFGNLVVVDSGDIQLLLGDDATLAQKVPLIEPILSQVAAHGRRISALDLRAPGTPVVRYR